MTNAAQSVSGGFEPSDSPVTAASASAANAPAGWNELRGNEEIQFEPVDAVPEIPREPGWFEEMLRALFEFLGAVLSPIGSLLAGIWWWLQWALLAALVAFILYLIVRTFGPLARGGREKREAASEPDWAPSEAQSVALLEDADRLAAEGRFDEATHLLLQRSVDHISSARPDWVEPSSTARELAALPTLSQTARRAFGAISERVERSLFALRSLDRSDWEAARAAYADFAQMRIGAGNRETNA